MMMWPFWQRPGKDFVHNNHVTSARGVAFIRMFKSVPIVVDIFHKLIHSPNVRWVCISKRIVTWNLCSPFVNERFNLTARGHTYIT